jgi:hypothetical protein
MAAMDHPLAKARNRRKSGQRYYQDMTGPEQDAIASQIIDTLVGRAF